MPDPHFIEEREKSLSGMFLEIPAKGSGGNIDGSCNILKFNRFVKIQDDVFMNFVKPVKIEGVHRP